ncbi:MAG: polymer-forming cytoskeletal protein [Gammaproteobacteria bacterium]
MNDRNDRASGTATIIGEGVRISGTIAGTGSFIVCGEVESDCDLDGSVTLAREGHWKGTIRATEITIAGNVEGDVRTDGKIEVASTARVRGSLIGRMISVAEGAVIDGEMQMTGSGASDGVVKLAEKVTV